MVRWSLLELSSSSRFARVEGGGWIEFSWKKEGEKVPTENCGRGTRSTFGSTCNSFELKPIPHMAEAFRGSFVFRCVHACFFVMQARLLDICLTCLLGHCILEGRVSPFEDETKTTLIVNNSWRCFGGKIIFRTRKKDFDPLVLRLFLRQSSKEMRKKKKKMLINHYWWDF